MEYQFDSVAEKKLYEDAWDNYARAKFNLHGLNYGLRAKATPWPANMGQTIRKSSTFNLQQPMPKQNTPGNITHKQLVRSWNKVSRTYIKEGRSIFNVTKEAWEQGYEQCKKEVWHKVDALEEVNKALCVKHNNNESAIKLANAMGQSQDAMAHAIKYILGGV